MPANFTYNVNADAAGDRKPLPENPKFPEGLRVLVVDDDPSSLKIISVMLQRCKYQVTSMKNATEALEMLRKNKESYDIVLTDVRMPEMDGFELLKIIGIEMDIPVIMISVDDSRKNVMEGVMHGARDYLVKPVRMTELKNIWQHVMRKTVLNPEKSSLMTQEIVMDNSPHRKRRGKDEVKEDVSALSDRAPMKKRRFAWSGELHQKFVQAVHALGVDKAVPKQIVELMNDPELTREIVASHLQKYRGYLKKTPTEQHSFNAGQRGIPEASHNPTPTSYPVPILKEENNGSSGSGVMSFREHLSRTDILSNSRSNANFLTGNQQGLWFQQNYNSPQMSNQAQAPKPISVHGNMPLTRSLVANPSGRVMMENYVDMSSQIPNYGTVQFDPSLDIANFAGHSCFTPGLLPSTDHASHPCPSGVFNSFVGNPYQMLDGCSNQRNQSFQLNAFPGQLDGRVSQTAFNGGYPVEFDMDRSRVNGQGSYMQLLTGNIYNNYNDNLSSIDDDVPTEGTQSGPTPGPMN